MIGGFSTPRKDKAVKSSGGKLVKAGEILVRGIDSYKAGVGVRGLGTLFAAYPGKVYFTRKKTSHGRLRTFVNIAPLAQKEAKK
ncbi:MAG: 50S ribosomal protein L27 [Candidatus Omnitrophica bacterium]|nr:50S ribosomal protein L27 [Candidatus Omnitrophota bacterium]MBU1923614.1 50S ribosomal protein L27 [Candidatus Omnitrophota bacterium]